MTNYWMAGKYDILLFPFLNKIRKKTAKIIIEINPDSLIDICCGTGNQLKFLLNTPIKLFGIDNSPAMLKASKGIQCYHQDARNIEFNERSFEMAIILVSST